MKRRNFIKAASAAIAMPYIIPASVLGKNAPSNRINICGIGVKGQGFSITNQAMRLGDRQNSRVVAVCDVDGAILEQRKSDFDTSYNNKECKAYKDFRDVMADPSIDAVMIGTPDHWHAVIAIAATKAGKDIYCEKPLTHTLEEGQILVDRVKQSGVVFQTGSMQRASEHVKRGCELVRNGYLGKIHHVEVGLYPGSAGGAVSDFSEKPPAELDYDFWVGPAKWAPYHKARCHYGWRWWMDFGGGNLMDWIGHHGDMAQMALGTDNTGPVEVSPDIWLLKGDQSINNQPLRYRINYKYADGMTMTVGSMESMSKLFRAQEDTGVIFYGEKGKWLFISRGGLNASDESLLRIKASGNDFRFPRRGDHVEEWLKCIRTRTQPIAPVNAGHRSASIGNLGVVASKLKQTLEWDPAKEVFIGNEVANRMKSVPCRGEWSLG